MSLGLGGIVSLGGGAGGSGSGGSGIQELNGQVGPVVTLIGTSGIVVEVTGPNEISIGISGIINTSQSGVIGVNGITVHQVNGNFVIDGAALSGQSGGGSSTSCFEASFAATTSGFFQHNLGTRSLVVQVSDDGLPPRAIFPDAIVFDTLDALSVLFNAPQAGSITILTCGVADASGVHKFSQALTGVVSASIVHSLGSEDVIVQVRDTNQDVTIPDRIRILDLNTVSLQFNSSFSGRVVIVG
jgi:hypothetical protein